MRRSSLPTSEERRDLSLAVARPEVRADDAGAERFGGHAAVFNERTAIGNPLTWGFYEEVADGAFTKTLDEGDSRFLIDHDSYYVVARKSAGTLDLAQDKIGLEVDSALDDELSYVKDLKANLRNGNITGMSFGFYVMKDDWELESVELTDGTSAEVEVRIIREVRLIEVSAVTFPAYEATDAGLRSAVLALRSRGDVDAIARRAGFRPEMAVLLDEVRPARSIHVVNPAAAGIARNIEGLPLTNPDGVVPIAPVPPAAVPAELHVDDARDDTVETDAEGAEQPPVPSAVTPDPNDQRGEGEPGETTRTDPETPTDDVTEGEPAETTRTDHTPSEVARLRARRSVLATTYGLPMTAA